ncbi:nucleotidyltransferase domain-containing protein [Nocardioides humi]|uniref:Nucleotidyltransferase domain-containing protein n=1 Tax=Nocardioides humi TaxID=449461 RepID=A0ABN2BJZ2_9ACTN|nr:nucleotidyltransferase domain-containing protein [Nocardioides humi]
MRAVPDDFDPSVVAAIDARLADVAASHGVRIPWAIESGSRAWGFASPDSDYDCRFLFVRPRDAYLALWPARDVIETPLDDLLDVNGWDLAKAVRLATAGNATVGEWLRSPHVYGGEPGFRDDLLRLVAEVADTARVWRHYLHVGRGQWAHAREGPGEVRLKRVFYAIRPAVTLRWLDEHEGVPPMSLDELLDQVEVPDDVRGEVAELRVLKARTRELGRAPVPPAIAAWVEGVLAAEPERPAPPSAALRARAEAGFLDLLGRWAPAGG